ncbi:MAG TPA: MmgE/PrpD family protein [Gemmataceae bacterium]|nr:MmgE/PrpD family protein [Gemmataceae bacterium]
MTMTSTLAQRFAAYATRLRFEQLPKAAVHEAKRRLIDSFATAVGAMSSDAFAIARQCAVRTQSTPGATLLGGGWSSVEWATFLNGLLIRYLDFNDTYLSKEPAHPSDNLAPVLAVGESLGASGRDMLTATVLAYEIQCRLCDACSLRKQGVDHVTYGAISSAIAAAKLMGLDAEKTTHAIGLAGVCNVALRQTRSGELSMWKGCAFANAARNGVFAATLASAGMTGPAPIFEGDLGFMRLVTREPFAVAPMGAEFDSDARFMITDTYIKFWPAEYHSQSAIDAALQLRQRIGDVSKIAAVDIYTFEASYNIIGKYAEAWSPKTRETADHSLPYCTAVALLDGEVTLRQFDPARFTAPDVLGLLRNVKVHLDDALTPRYPRGIPNRIVVTLNDGRKESLEVEFPRGHAGNPMTDDDVEAKFRALVEGRYGRGTADAVLAKCWKFEDVTNVTEVLELLGQR